MSAVITGPAGEIFRMANDVERSVGGLPARRGPDNGLAGDSSNVNSSWEHCCNLLTLVHVSQ
jgi:hypothetical protein